jgi:hypothetical protein
MTNSEKYFIVVDRKVEIDTAVKSFKNTLAVTSWTV